MYREEEWRDGWLWVKSTPDGAWWALTERQMIAWLIERVAMLNRQIADLQPAN